ncbi:MAG TPA: ATP-dependent DNA ligase [Kofleriaceae bacterium]|nr:ATP-dependent DNA ligase [Kofleriaceae bacterium]
MLLADLVATSARVTETSGRNKKIELLAACLRQMSADERAIGARYLAAELPQKTNIGYATVAEVMRQAQPAAAPWLTLGEVDRRFTAIAELRGAGSSGARKDQLGALLSLATEAEQRFLAGLSVGEVRQGALDGLVVEAIAKAAELPADSVRRAYMLAGELGEVAAAALEGGAAEIGRFGLTLFRPILPMLAQTAGDAADAIATFGGPASLEYKLDGFRVQLHKEGEIVKAYSRALNEVTDYVPEAVAAVAALPVNKLIVDGEAIVFGANGRPLPFQDTMKRFGKKGPLLADKMPLSLALFDALLVDDQTLITEPAERRLTLLDELAPANAVKRLITADPVKATEFYAQAIASGHEGVMAKALDAPYDAGNRGASWLKIKKVHRLDLVVLAAEWGSGRRKGWLSNIHLGARDPASGEIIMLGKTFKGMTDDMLRWQTEQFLAREVDRDGHIVYVRPEIVAEIAFNDVQRSPRYPAGLALRLARVVRYRDDKTAAQADTIDMVRAIAIADGVLPAA